MDPEFSLSALALPSLPRAWEWVTLGELVEEGRGVCYGIVQPGRHDPDGVPMVNSQDVVHGRVADKVTFSVARALSERFSRSVLKGREVLVTLVGANFGQVAVAPANYAGYNCSRAVGVVPVREDAEFVALALRSPVAQRLMQVWANTTAQPTFNLKDLVNLPVALPPRSERRAISDALCLLDAKIELNRRINETLEAMARALFKSWFVDFDPVRARAERRLAAGMDGATAALFPSGFEQSELREIPRGWNLGTVGSIATVVDCLHSKKPERQEIGKPFLQLSNILDNGLLDLSEAFLVSDEDYAIWTSKFEASGGDCVITNVGRVGAVAQMPAGFRGALGRNMTGLRCRPVTPYPTYLLEALLSQAMREEIGRKTDTGTILDALNVRNIPLLRLVVPPDSLMAAFERTARPLRARMEASHAESLTLAAMRDALLPRLLSGELRVRDADRIVERAV